MSDSHLPLPPDRSVPPLPARDEFAGKVALVTGGTDGLGKHLSRTLVELGADVFFCGRRVELGRVLQKEWGPRAHFVRCDLADVAETQAFVRAAGQFRGRLDYVVNNAAMDKATPINSTPIEQYDKLIAINLRPFFVVCQAALPYLEKGEGKAIVNISSTNYQFGFREMTTYNSAKAGIVGFSRSLARDLGPSGIRVNVVSPGWIMTERQLAEKVREEDQRQLLSDQCVPHLLTAQHVTPATLFLLSRAAAGICGQNLIVDGGKFFQ